MSVAGWHLPRTRRPAVTRMSRHSGVMRGWVAHPVATVEGCRAGLTGVAARTGWIGHSATSRRTRRVRTAARTDSLMAGVSRWIRVGGGGRLRRVASGLLGRRWRVSSGREGRWRRIGVAGPMFAGTRRARLRIGALRVAVTGTGRGRARLALGLARHGLGLRDELFDGNIVPIVLAFESQQKFDVLLLERVGSRRGDGDVANVGALLPRFGARDLIVEMPPGWTRDVDEGAKGNDKRVC